MYFSTSTITFPDIASVRSDPRTTPKIEKEEDKNIRSLKFSFNLIEICC